MKKNELNMIGTEFVSMGMSNEEMFRKASDEARTLGTQFKVAVVVLAKCTGGDARRVYVAYSNGVWVNTVDALCLDDFMMNEFIAMVQGYASWADANLGYNDDGTEKYTFGLTEEEAKEPTADNKDGFDFDEFMIEHVDYNWNPTC